MAALNDKPIRMRARHPSEIYCPTMPDQPKFLYHIEADDTPQNEPSVPFSVDSSCYDRNYNLYQMANIREVQK